VSERESASFGQPEWIQSLLPHRYPILLVDRVLEIEPKKRIVAYKNVTQNEPFFLGHFPGHPIMPGVLVIEAMAQAAGILLLHDLENRDRKLVYFSGIERARFRRPVVPGDRLLFEIEVERLRTVHSRFRGRATVDGQLAVEAVCSSTIVDR
jgi:3-hydroxyacyl-[acyl-carrier-protein] dehydratase